MTRLCSPLIRARGKLRAGREEQYRTRSGGTSVAVNVSELGNAWQEVGELPPEAAAQRDMRAQSYGGRETRASKFRIEQAVAADVGVRCLRKRSTFADSRRAQLAERQDVSSSEDDEGGLASDQDPESSGGDFQGLSSSERALAAAVDAYGRLEDFEGDAAQFPGQTGDVGQQGETVLCGVCGEPEGSKPCLICDECEQSFHVGCLKTGSESADGCDEWLCESCDLPQVRRRRPLGRVALTARYSMNRSRRLAERNSMRTECVRRVERSLKQGVVVVQDGKTRRGGAEFPEAVKSTVSDDCSMATVVKSEEVEDLTHGDESLGKTSDLHCKDKLGTKSYDENEATTKLEPSSNPPSAYFCANGVENHDTQEEKTAVGDFAVTESGGVCSDLSGDVTQSCIKDNVRDDKKDSKGAQDFRAVYALDQLKKFVSENCGMVSLDGWTATVKDRAKEGRSGSVRTYFFSPDKKRFASRQEVFRYFESLRTVITPSGEEHASSTGGVKNLSFVKKAVVDDGIEDHVNRQGSEVQSTTLVKRTIAGAHDMADTDVKHDMQSPTRSASPAISPQLDAYAGGFRSIASELAGRDPTQSQIVDVVELAQPAVSADDPGKLCKMTERELEAISQLQRYVTERNGVLGEGWTADITSRPKRGSIVCDVKYYSPDAKVFRSRAEVLRYLGLIDSRAEGLLAQEQSMKEVCTPPSHESPLMDDDKAAVLQQLKSFISEKNGLLDEGWDVEIRRRTGCNTTDKIYVSPDKQKFQSRLEVARFLGLDSVKTRRQGFVQKSILQLPVRSGELNIESLGELGNWTGGDGSTIWPVGYRSTWHDVHTGSFCISEVADSGDAGPVFRVTRRSCAIFLGRENCFGNCSGALEHTAGWAGVSSELKDEMGEFAVEASTPAEAWKTFAKSCADYWRASSGPQFPLSSVKELPLSRAQLTVESDHGHEIVVLREDSATEDEAEGRSGYVNRLVAESDARSMSLRLFERMGQDRFGLTDEVVQMAIKQHLRVIKQDDETGALGGMDVDVTGELLCEQESDLKQELAGPAGEFGQLEEAGQPEEAGEVILDSPVYAQGRKMPVGITFGSKLPEHLAGDVLEIWEFLCRFADVIGIRLPSFDDFEDGLIEKWEPSCEGANVDIEDSKHDLVSSAGCFEEVVSEHVKARTSLGNEPAEGSLNHLKAFHHHVASRGITALANIHVPLIKLLISDMKQKILGTQSLDAEELKFRQGKRRALEDEVLPDLDRESCLPMNWVTWPDVAHRYILALLAFKREDEDLEGRHQHFSRILRLLQGDGGVLYGGIDGMAGAEADAQLLGGVEKELLKKMSSSTDLMSAMSPVDDLQIAGCLTEDSGVKSLVEDVNHSRKGDEKELWVQILEPVAQIPTNTGARIRNRVQESLKEGPPDWARKVLEWSITKEIFKGNAAGPTKHAVLSVLATVRGEEVKPRKCRVRARKVAPSPALITQRCRLVLREVAAADTSRVFCFLYGNGVFDSSELEGDGSLRTTSRVVRPLDLRTIDLRLEAGVYMHSPDAFASDVRQIWKNAEAVYKDGSRMLRLSQKLAELFDELYEKQVTSLLQGGGSVKKRKDFSAVESRSCQPGSSEAMSFGKPSVVSLEKLGLSVKGFQNELSPDKGGTSELLKAPWDEESCRICGVDDDYDNVLLCDGCEAEYHTYCLKPPLTKVPEGKWFCPHCLALEKSFPERLLDDGDSVEDQTIGQYLPNPVLDKSPLRVLAERMEGREYWQLSTAEMVLLLKTLCDEALDTSIVRADLEKSFDRTSELQQKLRLLLAERSKPRSVPFKKQVPDESRAIPTAQEIPRSRVQTRAERLEKKTWPDETQNVEHNSMQSGLRGGEVVLEGDRNNQVTGVVLKRKRGRPPKVKKVEQDHLALVPGSLIIERSRPVEKKRGRPPKVLTNEEIPAKKRGRPPKKVLLAQPSAQGDSVFPVISVSGNKSKSLDLVEEERKKSLNEELDTGTQHKYQEPQLQSSITQFLSENQTVQEGFGSDEAVVCAQGKATPEVDKHRSASLQVQGTQLPQAQNAGDKACEVGLCLENKIVAPSTMSPETAKQTREAKADIPRAADVPNDDVGSDGELSVDSAEEASTKHLDLEIERLELEVMNMGLRREFVGRDNLGRKYWIICGPGRRQQVAVEEENTPDKGSPHEDNFVRQSDQVNGCDIKSHWMLYETESQLDELIACLRYSKQEKALRSSLLQWRKSLVGRRPKTELREGRQEMKQLGGGILASGISMQQDSGKVFFRGFPVLRATRILEKRFGPFCTVESQADCKTKGKIRRTESMYRCECLEPVWAGRPHCKLCHETCVDDGELMRHKCQHPGQLVRIRKTKRHSATSLPNKSVQAGDSVNRKRKNMAIQRDGFFSTQLAENMLQGDLHRVTKLKVRKRQSALQSSGEMTEGLLSGAECSFDEPYGVSPEFQGTLSTPCDTSGFRTGGTGDGGEPEIGGFADGNAGNVRMDGFAGDFSLVGSGNKAGNSRRSSRRKGVLSAPEQAETFASASKQAPRENSLKLLCQDVRSNANQDLKADTGPVGFVPPSAWGPQFDASCMNFSGAESTRSRVLQIGCIADKGPTFAPALSFAPAFDPSLMMQSRSDDTLAILPSGGSGNEFLKPKLFGTDAPFMNLKVGNESSNGVSLHGSQLGSPLYHEVADDGGCLSGSIVDFFATPDVDDQGWTMEEHARVATDDGVLPRPVSYEQFENVTLTGAADISPSEVATDGASKDNNVNKSEDVHLVCPSVEKNDVESEEVKKNEDVYVATFSKEIDGHEESMEVTEEKLMPEKCPGVSLVEYETPNPKRGSLLQRLPDSLCNGCRSPNDNSPDGGQEPVLEVNEGQLVTAGEGSPFCSTPQVTPRETPPDRVQQTAAETQHAEQVEVKPADCRFSQAAEVDGTCEMPAVRTPAVDMPTAKITARLRVPEVSLKPMQGKHMLLLNWLKTSLLDVEAALTPGMFEPARATGSRRRAWRSLVKSANSLFEVTRALFVLELMIKSEFLRSSWGHWFSLSAILKTANISSVALRLFTLDTATSYEVGATEPKKRGRKKKVSAEENNDVSD